MEGYALDEKDPTAGDAEQAYRAIAQTPTPRRPTLSVAAAESAYRLTYGRHRAAALHAEATTAVWRDANALERSLWNDLEDAEGDLLRALQAETQHA